MSSELSLDEIATVPGSSGAAFVSFLRSAGKLAFARQAAAITLLVAILALPALTSKRVTTDFVWTYFAMLTLTSLFGFGLERLAGVLTARREEASIATAIAPLLLVRVLTAPLVPIGLWVLFAFVGVSLPSLAWAATFVWVMAGLVEPVVFGALRAAGDASTEPAVMIAVRIAQAFALVMAAIAGASVTALVALVAIVEVAGALVALRRTGPARELRSSIDALRSLPHGQAAALVGIDALTLLDVRADLLLVGRMLGPVPGAVYGIAYRVVDGFNGIIGSAGLWLYAESVNERDGATAADGIRARSLALLPRLGIAFASVVVLVAGAIGELVPQLADSVTTIRILAAAFPLLTLNAIEAHVRSGRGRNHEMLSITAVALTIKIPLCIWFIDAYGTAGAATALVVGELIESMFLMLTASSDERRMMARPWSIAVVGAIAILVAAASLHDGRVELAVGAFAVGLGVVLWPSRARRVIARRAT